MKFISEKQSSSLVSHEMAFASARDALLEAAAEGISIFPAVLGHGASQIDRFSIKAATSRALSGLKVGSYWPGNTELGLPRHNSVILLFDQRVGRIEWVIEAGSVNAYRTAAADAVAVDVLARSQATVMAVFGTGIQAMHECVAIARVRPISKVFVVSRNPSNAESLVATLGQQSLSAQVAPAREAVECADIIVTATPAREPLFRAEWVKPGTHITSIGSDAPGKQELPPALLSTAALFCDFPPQSLVMGEFQHYTGKAERVTAIGHVLSGRRPGRTSGDQVTIFDSSGISLQDLHIARQLVSAFESEIIDN